MQGLAKVKQAIQPQPQIKVLVSTLLLTVVEAYKEHWSTTSYAYHKTTNKFFNEMPGHIDTLVEAYQGLYGLQDLSAEVKLSPSWESNLQRCKELSIEFGKTCEHSFISNICDEITAYISQTLYKITLK